MKFILVFTFITLSVYADEDIHGPKSVSSVGRIFHYFTNGNDSFVLQGNGTVNIAPSKNNKLAITGFSDDGGNFAFEKMHYETSGSFLEKSVKFLAETAHFYANKDTKLQYQKQDGTTYISTDGSAKILVHSDKETQSPKLHIQGHLQFQEKK